MTKPLHTLICSIATVVATAGTLRADTLTLRDGSVLTGSVKQVDGGYDILQVKGGRRFVTTDQIKAVAIDSKGAPDEATSRDRLISLRRSLENERDPSRAIDRYQQFLDLNAGTAAAKDAKAELATWQDRKDRGLQKVGKAWLGAAERDALLDQIAQRVDEIRALLAANQPDQANLKLRQATELDPDNISFAYLAGVLQFRRGQYADAKKSFDAVAEQVPTHPPTLLNQAVVLVNFKRWPQAAAALGQAMAAAPDNRVILDNVTEFLQLVPDAQRKTMAIEKLLKVYAVQEPELEQRLAKEQNLYRAGAHWVDKAGLDAAKKKADELAATKTQMENDYSQAQSDVRKIEEDAQRTKHLLDEIESQSYVRDPQTGRTYQQPYPDAYWDLKRDLDKLATRHKDAVAKVDDIKKKAADIQKQPDATATYDGKLTLVGEAGVPVLRPASAATQMAAAAAPTSQPAPQSVPPLPPSGAPYRGGPYAPPEDVAPATTRPTSQ